jgi:exodeoxyribonuclease VII small subunit
LFLFRSMSGTSCWRSRASKVPAMTRKKAEETIKEETKAPSFEQAIERLTAIVAELESGKLTLEQSLERFEEGVRLARTSEGELSRAEARIEELLRLDSHGTPVLEEIEP